MLTKAERASWSASVALDHDVVYVIRSGRAVANVVHCRRFGWAVWYAERGRTPDIGFVECEYFESEAVALEFVLRMYPSARKETG